MSQDLQQIFKAGEISNNSFETNLGLLVHQWIIILGLDAVIEGLDDLIQALEMRRDLENGLVTETPPVP